MEEFVYRGLTVRVWGKSFSVEGSRTVWLGNDNQKEVICSLIDEIADGQQRFIQRQLKEVLGL